MFTSKREVDRHVSQSTKNLSENERSSRGFSIAKTYMKVAEYVIARDWLQRYLDIKSEDAAAHKLMGDILEKLGKSEQAITSYQRSYNLNSKQNDLIKNVCRLFLVNDGWSSSPSKAKYWCELAENKNIRDDSVLSLRLKMVNKDKKNGGKPVEELILKEIASRPHEIGLRTRLVNFLLEEKRLSDAFKYCFDLEMKFIESFQQSIEWYNCVASCLQKQTVTDNWNYWCLLLISLDKRIYLNLKKDLSLQAVKQTNIKDVTNLIFEFDQVLKKASDSLVVLTPTKELADEFINHYRGQLALHVASIFIQKQKVANNDQWRDTIKKCLPFLLFAFQSSTVNNDAFWLKNTNDTIRSLFNHLKKEGAFRCAQSGRTILACKSPQSDQIVKNTKSWFTIEELFNQVKAACADLNWRKNVYRQLFANADQQTKISTSYIVQSSYFAEPKYEIISFNDLEMYEDIAQLLYPSSLEHHVYLGLGRKDLQSFKTRTFDNLNLSTSNFLNCSPETINRLDIDSFLYCAVVQAKRRLEAERDCYESFSKEPSDKPLILPAANLVEGLCSEEQNDWWLAAFKIYKNISGDSFSQLKATLQYGIEAVRGVDSPKMDVIILLKVGSVLLARSTACDKVDERRHVELRVESIFKAAMRLMRSKDNDNCRKIFRFCTTNLDVDREIDSLVSTAIGYLSNIYFKREEYKEFIEDFSGLANAWASFFIAESYKKLDESGKTPKKNRKLYAEKARENLVETLQLIEGSENFEKSNALRSRAERELKKIQYDLSTSFNEDYEFHNTSANGHVEDEIFHNASATSFRARRNASGVSQVFTEKFNEFEDMLKKMNDLMIQVKGETTGCRNDIGDLKDEVMNLRGEIGDLGKDSKALDGIYKAFEELSWNVTYMMNLVMPAANPLAAAAAAGSRFPPQAPPPQLFGQPNFQMPPMQYPTPAMVQRLPQAPAMMFDPMLQQNTQRSSLLEALNTPSLLTTWNNTYNTPQMSTNQAAAADKPQIVFPTVPAPVIAAPQSLNAFPTVPPQQQQPPPNLFSYPAPSKVQVEKAPPLNVVITCSDPLPTQNTFVSQPTLSVSIPPQHIKHHPAATKPVVPILTPQYENISPTKLDTSEYLEEPADYDPRPDFKPIIPLPAEVEVKTGEENEIELFAQRCKLFRIVEEEWKERGIGILKILKSKDNGKCRILMRREQVHKVCANHTITSEMKLKSTNKDTQWIWGASDYSEEQMQLEKFLVRFKTAEIANTFKNVFEDSVKKASSLEAEEKGKPKESATTTAPTFKFGTPTAATTNSTTNTLTSTPKATVTFGGFTGNLQTATPKSDKIAEPETKPAQPSPFANFTFGGSSANKSFSELFSGISTAPSVQVQAADTSSKANDEDAENHFEPNVHFEPVIALPDLIEVKTGEEEEEVKFVHRAKLLRYDSTAKEWKERGIGEMKVLVRKDDNNKARLLMRREQIFKLCCNMSITKEIELKKMNGTTYSFAGQDFSEGEIHAEYLAIKFKTSELVEQFVEAVKQVQKSLGAPKPASAAKHDEKKPTEGFGDAFKPKVGSWTCEGCYISNKAEALHCVACDSPKDKTVPKKEAKPSFAPDPSAPKFSFGMPNAAPVEITAAPAQGFGDAFKPKVGSWTCEGCYVSNKGEDLYCLACDAPKDSTVPKKEAKSAFAPDPNAPKFSFGMPNASGFSFGATPAADTNPKAAEEATDSFKFGQVTPLNSMPTLGGLNSTPNFSFSSAAQNLTSNSTGSGFSFGADKPFSFNLSPSENKENDDSTNKGDLTSTNSGFNFVFKKKSPAKKSPGKTRNDSVTSEHGEEEEDENGYHEEEENQTYFTPVIALPEKVEIVTGEEHEEALYSHRAKLFRFTNKEWKERGLGDVKILRHKETGKLRMVMRREQVFKICLNFVLTKEIEFKPKGDNSWTFGASDFSEGEYEMNSFAIRFKNAEVATEFKRAVNDALDGKLTAIVEPANDENSKLIAKLQLPANFFDYLNANDCPGCIGCKSDDYVFKTNLSTNVKADPHPLPVDQPKLTIKTTIKMQGQNVEKHVSFKINNDNSFSGVKKSDGSMNIFAKFNEENPASAATSPPNIFGTMDSFAAQKQPGDSIFSSSLNTTPTSTEAKITFGMSSSENGIFGVKSSFTFGTNPVVNGSVFGTPNKNETFGSSVFGNSTTQSADISSSTFSFADAAKELEKSKEESLKSDKSPNSSIFGSATKSFSFADAAKDLDQTKEASFTDTSSSNIFVTTVKSFTLSDTSKDLGKSPEKVPDFIAKSSDMGGFAALATNNETPTWATTAENKSAPPGGFFGLTVTSDIFSRQNADPNSSQNDDTPNDDNYDPHYDPIISLPDEIKVSTGEEDEIKIFSDRAKLFRFDTKLKEWKERGVGEFKILHHPGNGTYRLLLRREQIHKLVLNQLISEEIHLTPMNNSPKAFCWSGMNYAEGEGEAEQLAVRFKNEDIASNFLSKLNESIEKLNSKENLHPEND